MPIWGLLRTSLIFDEYVAFHGVLNHKGKRSHIKPAKENRHA